MPITHTPARRRAGSITTIPAKVSVSFDAPLNPDGSRPITAEEHQTLVEEILDPLTRWPATFADRVAPVAARCRRIIEQHGGRPGLSLESAESMVQRGFLFRHAAGYELPSSPEEASQCHFALEILWHLNFAQSPDIDQARRHAWDAGLLMAEAEMKFRWEPLAILGEKNRDALSKAGRISAEKKRKDSRVPKWRALVAARRFGSEAAARARIEHLEGLQSGTVKKAFARESKQKK